MKSSNRFRMVLWVDLRILKAQSFWAISEVMFWSGTDIEIECVLHEFKIEICKIWHWSWNWKWEFENWKLKLKLILKLKSKFEIWNFSGRLFLSFLAQLTFSHFPGFLTLPFSWFFCVFRHCVGVCSFKVWNESISCHCSR